VYRIKKLKNNEGPKGCRDIEREMKLVSDIKGGMSTEGVGEQGAEENIWSGGG
jgi:hypothetical protein